MSTNKTAKTNEKYEKSIKEPTVTDLLKAMGGLNTMLSNPAGVANSRKDALTDTIGKTIVDTVRPIDTGVWETGIEVDEKPWVIVEQYANETEAIAGHKKYVEEVKAGKKKFFDTQMEGTFEWSVA